MSNFGSAYIEEVVGFLLFVALIWWKLVPILKSLTNKKAASIKEQLDAGANAQKAAEDAINQAKDGLEKAKLEAVKIVGDARMTAERIAESTAVKAQQDAKRILAKVEQDVDFEMHKMRDEVTKEFSALVLAAARILLQEHLDKDLHHVLIEEAIDAVSKDGGSSMFQESLQTKAG